MQYVCVLIQYYQLRTVSIDYCCDSAMYSTAFSVELKMHWFISEELYKTDIIRRV